MFSNLVNQIASIMKNLRFIPVFLAGVLLGIILITIFKSKSEVPQQITLLPNSMKPVQGIDTYSGEVYRLTVDNIQYIVVENNRNDGAGIAIIKHQ
jgi:hypothetical protein